LLAVAQSHKQQWRPQGPSRQSTILWSCKQALKRTNKVVEGCPDASSSVPQISIPSLINVHKGVHVVCVLSVHYTVWWTPYYTILAHMPVRCNGTYCLCHMFQYVWNKTLYHE
jgi:hypothetical protein